MGFNFIILESDLKTMVESLSKGGIQKADTARQHMCGKRLVNAYWLANYSLRLGMNLEVLSIVLSIWPGVRRLARDRP